MSEPNTNITTNKAVSENNTQSLTNKSVNGVTLVSTNPGTKALFDDGTYKVLSAGGVSGVQSGTNITVDNTDPALPIINLDAAITSVSVNGVTLSNAGAVTNFLDESGNYSAPTGAVDSVNTQTGVVVLNTDNIGEGVANFYYTETRFDTSLSGKSSDNLSEGVTNLYNKTHTGDVTGAVALTIANNAVSNAKAADMPTLTMKGNDTGGLADPKDLTVAEVRTLLAIPILQVVRKSITASASSATVLSVATTPTSTSGDAYESLAITLAVANTVRIQMSLPIGGDNDGAIAIVIVSRGTTVVGVGNRQCQKKDLVGKNLTIDMYDAPGVGTHTYNFRIATTSNTAYFNEGSATANPWGGTAYRKNATITLMEIV